MASAQLAARLGRRADALLHLLNVAVEIGCWHMVGVHTRQAQLVQRVLGRRYGKPLAWLAIRASYRWSGRAKRTRRRLLVARRKVRRGSALP